MSLYTIEIYTESSDYRTLPELVCSDDSLAEITYILDTSVMVQRYRISSQGLPHIHSHFPFKCEKLCTHLYQESESKGS